MGYDATSDPEIYTLFDAEYEYDVSSFEKDNGMGPDAVHSFDSEANCECPYCGKILHIEGWIREYPIGAFDSEEIELDDEDNILLFEALLLDVMTEEEYKAYTESSEYIEDLKSIYNIDINKARPVIETMKSKVRLNVLDEIKRLAKIAVFTIARRKKLAKMTKLEKTWAKARKLEAELSRELGAEAIKMARTQYNASKKAKTNGTLKKAVTKKKNSADGATRGFFKYVK